MRGEPQLFRVDPSTRKGTALREVDFAQLGLQERRDIQEWVAANPRILGLGDDLLILAKEFSGFDKTNERLDLLAVDTSGRLVVIELKRDDTGSDAYWQAIKYASYLRRAGGDEIVSLFARHEKMSEEQAELKLKKHLDADDLDTFNTSQRIILASHRFAPEVTSAALWLNEQVPGDALITCIQLIPYRDAEDDSLYLQANTIIPVPGEEDYEVRIGSRQEPRSTSGFAANLQRTYNRNRNDEITHFLRKAADRALDSLSEDVRPNKRSKWAGGWAGGAYDHRYYRVWYRRGPWSNWDLSYGMNLYQLDGDPAGWKVNVVFGFFSGELASRVEGLEIHPDQTVEGGCISVSHTSDALDDRLADALAATLRRFIEVITPVVDKYQEENNQEEA